LLALIVPSVASIVSGGQTGAGRAALDWAIDNGIPHRGWCPKRRLAENDDLVHRFQPQSLPPAAISPREAIAGSFYPSLALPRNASPERFDAILNLISHSAMSGRPGCGSGSECGGKGTMTSATPDALKRKSERQQP